MACLVIESGSFQNTKEPGYARELVTGLDTECPRGIT